jgi:mannose-1-phosphate guanylyltransferase
VAELIKKPWGQEEIIAQNDRYAVKQITVFEQHRISLQYHRYKHETWIIEKGRGAMTLGKEMRSSRPGMVVDIPPNTIHRIFAGKGDTVLLEVSTPELDDIVRLADDYGRVK